MRSESRLRYATALLFTASASASATIARSARRHTVRAWWSAAAAGDPPGSTKLVERLQRLVDLVAPAFETRDLLRRDPRGDHQARRPRARRGRRRGRTGRSGSSRSSRRSLRAAACWRTNAEDAVELVDVAVGDDAAAGLPRPAHVAEVGVTPVAEAGVDARQPDHANSTRSSLPRRVPAPPSAKAKRSAWARSAPVRRPAPRGASSTSRRSTVPGARPTRSASSAPLSERTDRSTLDEREVPGRDLTRDRQVPLDLRGVVRGPFVASLSATDSTISSTSAGAVERR